MAVQRVGDLRRVAQAADPPALGVERDGAVAVADSTPTPEKGGRLSLTQSAQTNEDRWGIGGAPPQESPQVAPETVDVHIQDCLGERPAAARPRGAEPAKKRPLLGASLLEGGEPVSL